MTSQLFVSFWRRRRLSSASRSIACGAKRGASLRVRQRRVRVLVPVGASVRRAHLQGRVTLRALVQRHRIRREAALRPQLHARHARHEAQL